MAKTKTVEVKKTQTIEKYENNFSKILDQEKFNINAFKETSKINITSEAKLKESSNVMSNIKVFKKNVDDLYNTYYKPIADFAKKELLSPINELKAELKEIEDYNKTQQIKWSDKKRAEAEKKALELEEKIKKGELTLEKAGEKLAKQDEKVEAVKGVSIKKEVVITNFAELSDDLKLANMPLINKMVLKDGIEIKGTKVVERTVISNRY